MVDKDGVIGVSAAIGGNISSNGGIVQLAGTAMMSMCTLSKARRYKAIACVGAVSS
jgi:hypothetical protein